MKSLLPNDVLTNRATEASLQQTYEALITEIGQSKLSSSEKKKITTLLGKYRSAWNSYVNRFKPRYNRARVRSRIE